MTSLSGEYWEKSQMDEKRFTTGLPFPARDADMADKARIEIEPGPGHDRKLDQPQLMLVVDRLAVLFKETNSAGERIHSLLTRTLGDSASVANAAVKRVECGPGIVGKIQEQITDLQDSVVMIHEIARRLEGLA